MQYVNGSIQQRKKTNCEEFWNNLRDFTQYQNIRNYNNMQVQVIFWISLSYEYSKKKQMVLFHAEWDQHSDEEEYRKKYDTSNGFFEYDVRIKKRGKCYERKTSS